MNCKQGELALIVRVVSSRERKLLGRIVKCVEPHAHPWTGEVGWVIEPSSDLGDCILGACLRPIRPNGITDDEVRQLYAPSDDELSREDAELLIDALRDWSKAPA